MTNTVVINLIGAPGVGKSTLASEVFSILKRNNIDVELVSEFAKELVWEQREETMKNELYMFAKQQHRLFRLKGKVKYIITDRPLILSMFYNRKYNDASKEFDTFVLHEVRKFTNVNFLLNRTKPYHTKGRLQTEQESSSFNREIQDLVINTKHNEILNVKLDNDDNAKYFITDLILKNKI